MALSMIVQTRFFDSSHVPAMCLLSGRTDNLTPVTIEMQKTNWWWMLCWPCMIPVALIAGLILVGGEQKFESAVRVPVARGEKWKWLAWRKGGYFFLTLLLLDFVLVPMFLNVTGAGDDIWMRRWVFGGSIGLIFIIGTCWSIIGSLRTVSIGIHDRTNYILKFPKRMQPVFDTYLEAYLDFREEAVDRRNPELKYGSEDEPYLEQGEESEEE